MSIVLTTIEKGGEHTILHDLNFQDEKYEAKHVIVSVDYSQLYIASYSRGCSLTFIKVLQESQASSP
jgi:transcription initiation factor IIF auxiliary subunit